MTVYSYHVTYPRITDPHSIVALLSGNSLLKTGAKSEVLSGCNGTRTHNHLIRKRTLNWVRVPLQSRNDL